MYDIITVGSATVDAFIETDKKFVKKKHYTFPVGAKLLVKHLEFHTGGSATNTAVSFSRLGMKTAIICGIGKGTNSERIVKALKQEKIDTSLVCREIGRTAFSVIMDAEHKDRTIFAFKGCCNNICEEHIRFKKAKAKCFYFGSMMGESFTTQKKIAKFAKKNNISIAFNPSLYIAKKGYKHLKGIIDYTTILVMNRVEARALTKGKDDIDCLLKKLKSYGPEVIVITEGKKGAYAYDGEKRYFIKTHDVKILETTGAGDAFASTFVTAYMKTKDIRRALELGQTNSESVITHYGAKNKLLKWSELIKEAKRRKSKITEKSL